MLYNQELEHLQLFLELLNCVETSSMQILLSKLPKDLPVPFQLLLKLESILMVMKHSPPQLLLLPMTWTMLRMQQLVLLLLVEDTRDSG